MFLSALLLVAAVQASPAPTVYSSKPEVVAAIKIQEACRTPGVELAVNPAPTTQAGVQKLGDLPAANHTLTVLRSVEGCPVSSTVRFNVDRPTGAVGR